MFHHIEKDRVSPYCSTCSSIVTSPPPSLIPLTPLPSFITLFTAWRSVPPHIQHPLVVAFAAVGPSKTVSVTRVVTECGERVSKEAWRGRHECSVGCKSEGGGVKVEGGAKVEGRGGKASGRSGRKVSERKVGGAKRENARCVCGPMPPVERAGSPRTGCASRWGPFFLLLPLLPPHTTRRLPRTAPRTAPARARVMPPILLLLLLRRPASRAAKTARSAKTSGSMWRTNLTTTTTRMCCRGVCIRALRRRRGLTRVIY